MSLRAPWVMLFAFAACAPVQRVTLINTSLKLNDGRFAGPVEVKVPRHADHQGHDFEVNVRLVSACEPLLTLAFPDGEQQKFGVTDDKWQDLLRVRAGAAVSVDSGAPAPPPPSRPPEPTPPQMPPPQMPPPQMPPPAQDSTRVEGGATADAELRIPAPTVGSWQRTRTEQWAGQLEFEAQRERRCATSRTFTTKYRNAFDDTNTIALWADVPQELADAELFIEVVELIPPKVEAPAVKAAVTVQAQPRPAKPIPPMPAPRTERPAPAKDPNARWHAGEWVWSGRGEWVWSPGFWLRPQKMPAPQVDARGVPPLPDCLWVEGHWVWVALDGSWSWVPGHWGPPPPRVDVRGESPDPTSQWVEGMWLSVNGSFIWQVGRWGRPEPRAEARPPAPRADAEWIPGAWILVGGRWVWTPGFWSGTEKPPPPRLEAIPPRPHPDAVWLAGFWRWNVTTRVHVWVDGHWELPPGEGYVWVEEQLGPDLIIRGHWELRVR